MGYLKAPGTKTPAWISTKLGVSNYVGTLPYLPNIGGSASVVLGASRGHLCGSSAFLFVFKPTRVTSILLILRQSALGNQDNEASCIK